MEFYDEKDLGYWKKQAELGRAVIIDIPVSMLLDLDIRSLKKDSSRAVTMDDLNRWLDENKDEIERVLLAEAQEKEEVEKYRGTLYLRKV